MRAQQSGQLLGYMQLLQCCQRKDTAIVAIIVLTEHDSIAIAFDSFL